jgi:hypothetical protein
VGGDGRSQQGRASSLTRPAPTCCTAWPRPSTCCTRKASTTCSRVTTGMPRAYAGRCGRGASRSYARTPSTIRRC